MDAVRGPDGFVFTIVSSQARNLRCDHARCERCVARARTGAARDTSPSPRHDGRRVRSASACSASSCGNAAPASIDRQLGAVATLRAPGPHLRGDRDITAATVFGLKRVARRRHRDRARIRAPKRRLRGPEGNSDPYALPPLVETPRRRPAIAANHRAIRAGADHANACQRELHQKYFEPLTTVRAVITGHVAAIHARLENARLDTAQGRPALSERRRLPAGSYALQRFGCSSSSQVAPPSWLDRNNISLVERN
jgi:hypothetical protein